MATLALSDEELPDRVRYGTYYSVSGRLTVMALFVTAALCTMDRMILSLVVDPVRQDLGLSETQIGVLQGFSFSLLYALAGIPIGLMVDRISRTRLLAAAVLVWSLGTLACGLATSFGSLFFFRMMVGAGEAALWPVAVSLIGDLAPQRSRGHLVSLVIIGQLLGGSFSLIVGGQLLQTAMAGGLAGLPLLGSTEPWRILFILYGLFGAVAIGLLLFGAEPPREPVEQEGRSRHPLAGLGEFAAFFRRNWKSVGTLYLLIVVVAVVQYSGAAWNVPLLLRRFDLGPQQVGLIMGIMMFGAGALGAFSGGFVTKRTGKSPVNRCNVVIAAYFLCISYGLLVFNPGLVATLFLCGLPAVLIAMAGVILIVILQDLIPSHMRGIATSIMHLFSSLVGASIGPMIVAMLTQYLFRDDEMVGVSLGLVVGPSMMLAVLLAFIIRRQIIAKREEAAVAA